MARTVGLVFPGAAPVAEPASVGITCPHCGKEYKNAAALKAHVTRNHPHVFDDTK